MPANTPHLCNSARARCVLGAILACTLGLCLTALAAHAQSDQNQQSPGTPDQSQPQEHPPAPAPADASGETQADPDADTEADPDPDTNDGSDTQTETDAASPPDRPSRTEVFPHVVIDRERRAVEVAGIVPIDAHDPDAPTVYLELVACTPDTREHESLVVTKALPSHVHAALLLLGLEPGAPGDWMVNESGVTREPPVGPRLEIEFITTDDAGVTHVHTPDDWVTAYTEPQATDSADQPSPPPFDARFVFAGSRFYQTDAGEVYEADRTGTLVGLATFGMEVVALERVISHLAGVDEPIWIANAEHVPLQGTPVIMRLTVAPEAAPAEAQ